MISDAPVLIVLLPELTRQSFKPSVQVISGASFSVICSALADINSQKRSSDNRGLHETRR